jgi:GNAT superfamily N-acetyltransferase
LIAITTDRERLDRALIHRYLSVESYWAGRIPRDVVDRSIDHSLCFGAFDGDEQVGFARVISDQATFAYLADVFVVETHRGRGVAKEIMKAIDAHPSLQGLRRWQLVTRDAHALYAQFGFTAIERPEKYMERVMKDAYAVSSRA